MYTAIPTFSRQRQQDYKFEATIGYKDSVQNKNKQRNKVWVHDSAVEHLLMWARPWVPFLELENRTVH